MWELGKNGFLVLSGSTQSPAFWHFFQVDKAHEAVKPLCGVWLPLEILPISREVGVWECLGLASPLSAVCGSHRDVCFDWKLDRCTNVQALASCWMLRLLLVHFFFFLDFFFIKTSSLVKVVEKIVPFYCQILEVTNLPLLCWALETLIIPLSEIWGYTYAYSCCVTFCLRKAQCWLQVFCGDWRENKNAK